MKRNIEDIEHMSFEEIDNRLREYDEISMNNLLTTNEYIEYNELFKRYKQFKDGTIM